MVLKITQAYYSTDRQKSYI